MLFGVEQGRISLLQQLLGAECFIGTCHSKRAGQADLASGKAEPRSLDRAAPTYAAPGVGCASPEVAR